MAPRYEKPSVLSRVPRSGHVVIEASAGTGKTFTLEHLIVDLLLTSEIRIEEILVVTFTEKATEELKERIRGILVKLLNVVDTVEASPPDDRCWILDNAARTKLHRALLSLDSATISTIHAFCQRVLVENAFAHKRLLAQSRVDGRTAFSEAFADALRTEFARDTRLSSFLRLRPVKPANLEGQLFDCALKRGQLRPAWDPNGLREAILPFADATIRTAIEQDGNVHGVHWSKLRKILRTLETLAKAAANAATLSDAEVLGAVQKADVGHLFKEIPGILKPSRTAILQAVEALHEAACPIDAAIAQEFLPHVQERVQRRKRDQGQFDFDDMLQLVRDNLLDPHEGEALTNLLRKRFRIALIDEFQDTDEVQWDIFRRIFFESPDGHRLVLIGDPKQAIYRFRGADVATYVSARDLVRRQGGVLVPLTENHRATAGIIGACNRLFDQATGYFEGAVAYDDPVTCGKPDLALQDAQGQACAPVRVMHVVTGKDDPRRYLYAVIASEITTLLHRSPLFVSDGEKKQQVQAKDIFCLTASDKEGRELGDELRAAGIPVSFYKQDGLFQTVEARHVRRLLEAVDDPDHNEKRQRAWLTPFFAVELKDLAGLDEIPAVHPLVARLHDWHEVARRRHFDRLFGQILRDSGVARREMFHAESERALTNYLHLFELLQEEANRSHMALADLLRTLRGYMKDRDGMRGDEANVQRLETDRDAVQIMTMHKAKGLQASVVFIAGGVRRPFFGGRVHAYHDAAGNRCTWVGDLIDADIKDRIETERRQDNQRLLYVALTRARARLYLPYFGPHLPGDQLSFTGAYAPPNLKDAWYSPVHQRLSTVLKQPEFERVLIDRPVFTPRSSPPAESAGQWDPPDAVITPGPPDASFDAIVRSRPGVLVSSYSRLSREVHERAEVEKAEFNAEAQPDTPEPGADELPGGTLTGSYLHELLELLPLEASRDAASFVLWTEQRDVADVLRATARKFGFNDTQAAVAARLIFNTLTAPIVLPEGRLRSFSHASPILREMEFLYPIPEKAHPQLDRGGADPVDWTIGRGFIKGFVDVLFEHEGRAYFGDWKSDSLIAWDAASLARETDQRYGIQARLYSLALVRMLGIASRDAYESRFGGYAYVFLRGLTPGRPGREWLHVSRPSWEDILEWDDELRSWGAGEPYRPAA